jgi:ubiquitin C-terminal hydrolase
LFGVVFHLGASLNFGHYVSYVKASTAVQAKELPVFGDDLTVHRIATVGNQQTVVEEANSTKAAVIGSSDVSMTDGEPKQDDGMDLDATINKVCFFLRTPRYLSLFFLVVNELPFASPHVQDEPDRSKEWIYFDDEDTNFVSHEAFMSAMFPEVPTPRTPYILFYSKVEQ